MAETNSTPSVIASHVGVTYQVFGARKVGTVSGTARPNRLVELLKGKSPHVAAVRHVEAVRDVSFVAHHGESIAIIGRNGSGKSTLLRALAGLIPPSSGEVYLSGHASLLGVNAALMRDLSGERNIMIGGLALGLSPEQVQEKTPEIIEFTGLEKFIDLPMRAYSSGMQARLRFAISSAAVPDILMIDEALSTGDADFRRRSKERILEIKEGAGTVFLVSHNARTVRSICDRALWLEQGQLVMDGPVDEVMDAYLEQRSLMRSRRRKPKKKPAQPKQSTGSKDDTPPKPDSSDA